MKRKKKPIKKRKAKSAPITEERVRQIVREETNQGIGIDDMEVIIKSKHTGKIIASRGMVTNLIIQGPATFGRMIDLHAVFDDIDMR